MGKKTELSPEEQDRFIEEYKEVGHNMRLYGTLRYTQLSVFVAIASGLAVAPSITAIDLGPVQKIGLDLLGSVLAVSFIIIEASSTRYWKWFRDRARDIEGKLGLHQYTSGPEPRTLNATFATYLVLATFGGLFYTRSVIRICRLLFA